MKQLQLGLLVFILSLSANFGITDETTPSSIEMKVGGDGFPL